MSGKQGPNLEAIGKQMVNEFFQVSAASMLWEAMPKETDYSALTVQGVIDQISEFLKTNPEHEESTIFLHYLANYPVSLCQRKVSPTLKGLIGFHYRLTDPKLDLVFSHQEHDHGLKQTSYDDLARIFGRSKATISECVEETALEWGKFLSNVEQSRELKKEAHRQLC